MMFVVSVFPTCTVLRGFFATLLKAEGLDLFSSP